MIQSNEICVPFKAKSNQTPTLTNSKVQTISRKKVYYTLLVALYFFAECAYINLDVR